MNPDNDTEVVLVAEADALPGRRDDFRRAIDDLIPNSIAEQAGLGVFALRHETVQGHRRCARRFRRGRQTHHHLYNRLTE